MPISRWLPLAALALLAASCGGGSKTTTHARAASSDSSRSCSSARQARALALLRADVTALQRAAALPTKNALLGNAAVNRATDRFLQDVSTAPVDNLVRNRMIDHAAAALLGACGQCFQALEAQRPIPAIAHGIRGPCAPRQRP